VGDALTRLLVTASAIPDTLWGRGLRQDENAMIRQRSPISITEELFYDYISTVFMVPKRNGCPSHGFAIPHMSERIWRMLGENHMMAITFRAHTTNLFQTLDLVSFEMLEKRRDEQPVSSMMIQSTRRSAN
jgi:hypothetical protein